MVSCSGNGSQIAEVDVPAAAALVGPAVGPADIAAASRSQLHFGIDLLRDVSARQPGANLMLSPLSLSAALALAGAGARGETAAGIAATLHRQEQVQAPLAAAGEQLRALTAGDGAGMQLDIVNRLWVQRGFTIDPAFLQRVSAEFAAAVAVADFAAGPEPVREEINAYVAERTRQKIRELLPAGSVDALTRLVITNAVYFKGDWDLPFPSADTLTEPFLRADGSVVEVPLMRRKELTRHAEVAGLEAVELSYRGGEVTMLCVLPPATADVDRFLAGFDEQQLANIDRALAERKVEVFLPRFSFAIPLQLNATLIDLGMERAFDPARADFSGITTQQRLCVQSVVHQAFIEVNERGTEAAAATGVTLGVTMVERNPVFRADRPFLFLIRHRPTGASLFLGWLADPGTG